jgi:RNA polymerase sigma-70 factor (ECF subfamily)
MVDQADDALERAAKGDQSAFGELVEVHQAKVFSLAYHFLRDRGVAEELAQEVFLELYRSLQAIKSPAHLTFWLRKVTTHRAIDQVRRSRVRPQVSLDEVPEPAQPAFDQDLLLSETLRRLVGTLPEKARMVVILRYQEDLDPGEIAQLLDMPVNTVKSHLQRSLAILRKKMARCLGDVTV